MELFSLPPATKVNKVIPKNAFDCYTSTKQKKLFSELISRILWVNKLSTDTINLNGKDIKEIQIFKVELKTKSDIQPILEIIDTSIPYHIIFVVEYDKLSYISTSPKHPHPIKIDRSVLDWNFKTDWFPISSNKFKIILKTDLDTVYYNFCNSLHGNEAIQNKPFTEVVSILKKQDSLKRNIEKLKSELIKELQFNKKVELNIKIKNLKEELKNLTGNH